LAGREPILARAQLVIARENGFASWPALVLAAEANVEGFVRAATSGHCERARRLLSDEIAADPWARLVLGGGWEGDASEPGGPLGWAPLLYATHSCFPSPELVADLLSRGADPNATFSNEYGEMPALYGAAGVVHSPEITRLLLEAGADPDDGESVYHAVEASDPACLALLIEHGAQIDGTSGLAHALDFERLEPVRMMLEAGADAREVLGHAVRRGRGPECIRALVAHGAELEHVAGETWRRDAPLRTPYQHAVLRGMTDVAETLAGLGASVEVSPADLVVADLARGEAASVPGSLDYDQQEVVILAALRGHLDVVVDALGPEFGGVVGGSPWGRLIHHGAWVGSPAVVGRLLERGADPVAESGAEYSTPLAWCHLGSQYWEAPGRDYVAVARLLLDAGAVYEPRFEDVAAGPLADASLSA
jgi:ankyrin repeat protein